MSSDDNDRQTATGSERPIRPQETAGPAVTVIYHADDYGITLEQSRRILDCSTLLGGHGVLSSLSIMVTSPAFPACADLLASRLAEHTRTSEAFHVGVHLNVVEGPCCADPTTIPLLVDDRGIFRQSFVSLLRLSDGRAHDELRAQLEIEVAAQLERAVTRFPHLADHLRIDGHQHFQLIPALFDATLAVVAREGYHLDYLRIPAEPILPFLQTPGVALSCRPVNWVKHWVLNWLWRRDRRSLEAAGYRYERVSAVFLGILLSGRMDAGRVGRLLPHLEAYAARRGMALELLFHPGAVDVDGCLDPALTGFVAFYTSEGRDVEREALVSLGGRG